MKKTLTIILIAALANAALAETCAFTYQAMLRDEKGAVIKDGENVKQNHEVEIRLYDVATGGTALWGRKYSVLTDEEGLFNVAITDEAGSELVSSSLSSVLKNGKAGALFLGLKVVGSSGEIVPRQTIYAAPYAAVAGDVKTATGDLTVGGNITLGGGSEQMVITKSGIQQTGGSTTLQTLRVNGSATVGGSITAGGGVMEATGSGVTVRNHPLIVENTQLNVNGQANVGGSATVDGDFSAANGVLTVNGSGVKVKDQPLNVQNGQLNVNGSEVVPVPVGGIIMWTKAELPDNTHWAICNGQTVNGVTTPDLTGRFVLGANAKYTAGQAAGEEEVKLTESQMPSHRHYYVGDDQLEGIETYRDCSTALQERTNTGYDATSQTGSGYYSKIYLTSATGGNQAHNNMPPYYALYFIMRVK